MTDGQGAPTAVFACPVCGGDLTQADETLSCAAGHRYQVVRDIPRFVESDEQHSFGLQWNRFDDVQLDSRNGTTLTRDRILRQSQLSPADFSGRRILEVGCGSGRFTEVLLGFGGQVVALDYSNAVDACARLNGAAIEDRRLVVGQADVFALPVRPRSFDIVMGYGMLQHTGNADRALHALWEHVAVGGLLLVDRYQLDLRHVMPFKYALRPITRRLPAERLLRGIERMCEVLVPIERQMLRGAQGNGWRKYVRYALGRFPNSIYPVNLELQGLLDPDLVVRWSVLETFDQYAPRYDSPCTAASWRRQIANLPGGETIVIGSEGQGNTAVVRRAR